MEPLTQERFNKFCSHVVRDISPLRIWNKSEIVAMIEWKIKNWLDHAYRIHGEIHRYELEVTRVGQSLIQVNLSYEHGWKQIVKLTSMESLMTRSEACRRLSDNVMTSFISNEIMKSGSEENPMLKLLVKKLTT